MPHLLPLMIMPTVDTYIHKDDGKIYSFTIEFDSNKMGFIPPITEMRNIIKEISSAMTELCMIAYNIHCSPILS